MVTISIQLTHNRLHLSILLKNICTISSINYLSKTNLILNKTQFFVHKNHMKYTRKKLKSSVNTRKIGIFIKFIFFIMTTICCVYDKKIPTICWKNVL